VPDNAVLRDVVLEPLTDAKCRKLLGYLTPAAKSADPEFADWCVRTSTGNPYFLIELGRRASSEDGKFVAPTSLTRLVAQRFQEVAPISRRLLQAAAILGPCATLSVVERVLGERRLSLLDSLDELSRASLASTDGERLRYQHDLLGMSAISEISSSARKLLHHHAARVLEEELTEGSPPADLWEVARHFEQAGETARAIGILDRCAERSMDIGAPVEAIRILDHSIALSPIEAENDSRKGRRMRALYFAREYRRIVVEWRESLGSGADIAAACRGLDGELFLLEAILHFEGVSPALLNQTVACAGNFRASPNHRVGAALIGCKAAHEIWNRDVGQQLLEVVTPIADAASRSLSLELQVVFHGSFGDPAQSATAARLLRDLKQSGETLILRTRSLMQCATAFALNGERDESAACGDEACALANALQIPAAIKSTWLQRVNIANFVGDHEAVDRLIEGPWPDGIGACNSSADRVFTRNRIRRALRRGELNHAGELLGAFDSIWARDDVPEDLYVTELRADYLLATKRWIPSKADVNRLRQLHERWKMIPGHDTFLSVVVDALTLNGQPNRGLELVDAYCAHSRHHESTLHPRLLEAVARAQESRDKRLLE
jgi:hypothetical protein